MDVILFDSTSSTKFADVSGVPTCPSTCWHGFSKESFIQKFELLGQVACTSRYGSATELFQVEVALVLVLPVPAIFEDKHDMHFLYYTYLTELTSNKECHSPLSV